MSSIVQIATEEDDALWATRNEHWLTSEPRRRRAVRERPREPLILCGHGVQLRIEHGALVILNGFTHFPQERQAFRFFKGDLNLPPKIIMLDGSGSLSFDVLTWLSEQGVHLARIGWQGDVVSVLAGSGSAFDPERIDWQVRTRADPSERLAFGTNLILEKLHNSIETLRRTIPDWPGRRQAVEKADAAIDRLAKRVPRTIAELMLTEARAAAAYFQAWRALPLRWKQLKSRPIPDHWRNPTTRRSDWSRPHSTNRHATHPVNAMLNYAYAVLHSQVQTEIAASGYDPCRGIMHESHTDSRAFVLDLMEPIRPLADATVLKFLAANAFSAADFVIRIDGVCRLAPQLARRVASLEYGFDGRSW